MRVSLAKNLVAIVVVVVSAAACGGGVDDSGVIESQAGVPDGPTESSLPLVESSGDGSDDAAVDVVDEIAADESGAAIASSARMVALPAEDSAAAILELGESMLGPTDDISGTISQLYPFPEVPTPPGAHIMGFHATTGILALQDDETIGLSTITTVKVDLDRLEAVEAFEAGLAPFGWVLEETFEDLESAYGPQSKLRFDTTEGKTNHSLQVDVQSNESLGVTTVTLRYHGNGTEDPGNVLRSRFLGWHGDVPLIEGGELKSAGVFAQFGPGRSELAIESNYTYDGVFGSDRKQVGDMLVAKAESAGVEFERVNDYITLPRDEFDRATVGGGNDSLLVRGEVKVVTPPFSGVEVVGEEKSAEPLPIKNTSTDEIQDVVSDIYGLTADVAAQMQRIGPFPDLPNPDGSDITHLGASISKGNDDQFDSAQTSVTMFVNGEYDDAVVFYEAQLAALGFTVTGSRTRTEEEGLTTITETKYEGSQIIGDSKPRVTLEVTDDADKARTKVSLNYVQNVLVTDGLMERWTNWYGDGLPPDGGEIRSAGVTTRNTFAVNKGVYYNVSVDYPDKNEIDVLKAIADSDFSLAENEEPADVVGNISNLEHPEFAGASIFPLASGEKNLNVSLSGFRPLKLD